MALPLVVDGVTFNYPQPGDRGNAQDATDWADAITDAVADAQADITALQSLVYVRANITSAQTGITSFTTIIFNTEDADSDGAYNAASGVFTAPETGYYLITAGVVVQQKTSTALSESSLFVNNVQDAEWGTTNMVADQYGFHSNSVVYRLAQGDTVQIKLKTAAGTVGTAPSNTSTLSIIKLPTPA